MSKILVYVSDNLLYKNQSWLDSSWFDYIPFLSDYLQPRTQKQALTIFQRNFYTRLFDSVWDDIQFVGDAVYNCIVYLCELFSSILALFSLVVLVCVCLSVSLYKETRDTKKRKRQVFGKKAKDKTGLSGKNGHVCCEHREENFRNNKVTGNEPPHDKTNEMTFAYSEDSDQPGHLPSLIRVFAVRSMGSLGPKVSSCRQQRLWSD